MEVILLPLKLARGRVRPWRSCQLTVGLTYRYINTHSCSHSKFRVEMQKLSWEFKPQARAQTNAPPHRRNPKIN